MALVGNPHEKLRAIHIAGTSGKTSTTYYCAALLQQQGLQVGMTASPHVDNINERLQINGVPLPEAEYCALLSEFMDIVNASDIKPSYFELLTALSYWEFAKRGLDYVVIEVGMGGQLDATNVLVREDKVCIITDIGFDHTAILGNTLASISGFKAGIIKPQNHVFMYEQGAEVMDVVQRRAVEQQTTLHTLTEADQLASLTDLPGFQQRNLGLALQTVNYVNERDGRSTITNEQLTAAAKTIVPARLESFKVAGKTIFLDGSHNQQKMHALVRGIAELYPGQDIAAVVGFVSNNNDTRWQGGLDELFPVTKKLIFTSFYGEQDYQKSSVDPALLQQYASENNYQDSVVATDVEQAVTLLLEQDQPILLLTGSFYLMSHVRAYLKGLV